MSKADQYRSNALHEVGEDYEWAHQGTGGVAGRDEYDCSGFFWAMLNDVGIRIGRTTADGYRRMGSHISAPGHVGRDFAVLLTNGHAPAHHIILYIGSDDTVEAKGEAWGVIRSSVGAANKRGARWYRLAARYDIGELTGANPRPTSRRYPGRLRKGARGNDVRWVQKRLNVHHIKTGVDGVYGPQTASNVRAFRKARRMLPGSSVGPNVWKALAK
jgi:cell wall-associated NlpC family hydrolase